MIHRNSHELPLKALKQFFFGLPIMHLQVLPTDVPKLIQLTATQVTITRFQRGTRHRPWGFVSETCSRLNSDCVGETPTVSPVKSHVDEMVWSWPR